MLALTILFLLTVKHAICDLYLQSYLTIDKRTYTGGWPHYLHHGIGTLVVVIWFCNPLVAVAVSLADFVVHWNIDWGKHKLFERYEHSVGATMDTQNKHMFWLVQSIDQILHFVTYYVLCMILVGHS